MQEIMVYDLNGNSLSTLVQWDKNVGVQFIGIEINETARVHFFTNDMEEAYVVVPEIISDQILTASIPNVLLTQCKTITGYVNLTNQEEIKSIYGFRINVRKAPKPSNYIYDNTPDYISLETVLGECREYARSADQKANDAAISAENSAKASAAAKESEQNAAASKETAVNEATKAAASAASAKNSENDAQSYSLQAKSYAVGTDGAVREDDNLDNAKYYFEQASLIVQGLKGALLPMGTITFAELSELSQEMKKSGYMYNISDSFTTDETFKDGPSCVYPAGTNVYYTVDGYWDCLAGMFLTPENFEEITDEYIDGLFTV